MKTVKSDQAIKYAPLGHQLSDGSELSMSSDYTELEDRRSGSHTETETDPDSVDFLRAQLSENFKKMTPEEYLRHTRGIKEEIYG